MGTINDKPSLEKTVERMLSSEFVGKIWGGDESRGDSLSIDRYHGHSSYRGKKNTSR
jgi:hypothetical protein